MTPIPTEKEPPKHGYIPFFKSVADIAINIEQNLGFGRIKEPVMPPAQPRVRISTTTPESTSHSSALICTDTIEASNDVCLKGNSHSDATRSQKTSQNPIYRFIMNFLSSKYDPATELLPKTSIPLDTTCNTPSVTADAEVVEHVSIDSTPNQLGHLEPLLHANKHDNQSSETAPIPVEGTYSDDSEAGMDDPNDRRDFEAIRGIPSTAIEELVLKLVHTDSDTHVRTCRVVSRKEGSFHHAVIARVDDGDQLGQEYVLKIPAHGIEKHWQKGDAFMLRDEAMLMQHIRYHTNCPVPQVIAFDTKLSNAIGAPFILMEKLPGISALDLWLGQPFDTLEVGTRYANADEPTQETEQKRNTFLHSLSQAMSQLRQLEFSHIGTPMFAHPKQKKPSQYGPVWRWHSRTAMKELTRMGPFMTSESFFKAGIIEAWNVEEQFNHEPESSMALHIKGVHTVLDIIFSMPPFVTPVETIANDLGTTKNTIVFKEPFVLCHDDLDLQNILVDEAGKVTGIIDWDGCMTVRRCIGYSATPTFLGSDWLTNDTMAHAPHISWSLDRYRDIYAKAMQQACTIVAADNTTHKGDAIFTRKSPI